MSPIAPLSLSPLPRPPDTVWRVPGSKSISNRALVLAALGNGDSVLEGLLESDDVRYMREGLRALGIAIETLADGRVCVHGGREHLRAPDAPLFIGNSGTSVRFLAALATLVPGPVRLEGDEHMGQRPIADLVAALEALGVRVDCPSGCPPLTVHGGALPGGRVELPGDKSSQYCSALLMAAAAADAPVEIAITGSLVSRPYVAMTTRMMADFGVAVHEDDAGFALQPAPYRARDFAIEPDATAASYPWAAALATGGRITVPGLQRGGLQGDVAFVDVLARMGATVEEADGAITVVGSLQPSGVDADLHHLSDTVMTLAALAPLCSGPVVIRNIGNIRIKETDRLSATATELRRLGQRVETGDDWLRIDPQPSRPACVQCYHDHRMAMSFAVLGLARPGVSIADPACVGKTYPGFFDDLEALSAGGHAQAGTGHG